MVTFLRDNNDDKQEPSLRTPRLPRLRTKCDKTPDAPPPPPPPEARRETAPPPEPVEPAKPEQHNLPGEPVAEAAGQEHAAGPSPRRRRRRRKPATAVIPKSDGPTDEHAATGGESEPDAPPPQARSEAEPQVDTAIQADRPRRRRRRRKPKVPGTEVIPTAPEPSLSQVIKRAWHPRDNPIEPVEGKIRFLDLDIPVDLLHAISDMDWAYCTPIQAAILPAALSGRDCTGKAQTGTGKTAAFLISIMTRLLANQQPDDEKKLIPRALILAPTRELVQQIEKDAVKLAAYTSIRVLSLYGGAPFDRQYDFLVRHQPEIIMATPGRLIDFIQRGKLHLTHADTLVIDEADRMLDMGFIPDVRSIVRRLPPRAKRHTMMFSATLTPEVLRLASQWLNDPCTVEIEPERMVVETVHQRVLIVENNKKLALLYNLISREKPEQVIVFANRRETVREVNDRLQLMGFSCGMISGELPQNKREKVLDEFKNKSVRILIATDVAGRGLHIEGISHVVNYNLPTDPEDYVHRIGRTGRAGAFGTSISFACEDESFYLPDIEDYVGHALPCERPAEDWLEMPPHIAKQQSDFRRTRSPGGSGPRRSGRGDGRRPPPRGGNRRRPPRRP